MIPDANGDETFPDTFPEWELPRIPLANILTVLGRDCTVTSSGCRMGGIGFDEFSSERRLIWSWTVP